jgi:hypothetical protein
MLPQESLSENMTDLIESEPIDWLKVFPHVLANAGNVFTTEEIKTLRLVCRLTRDHASSFLKKLRINTGDLLDVAEYHAIASSSLLRHIRELDIYYDDLDVNGNGISHMYSLFEAPLISILALSAPRLRVLKFNSEDQLNIATWLLNDNVEYPELKKLELLDASPDGFDTVMPSLLSMTKISELTIVWTNDNVGGLQILERLPFIENLTSLKIFFLHDSDKELTNEMLSSLLPRPTNLNQLSLRHPPSMTIFRDLPFENLERLTLRECYFSDNYSLPRKLTYLKLEHCCFASKIVLWDLFSSGKLPLLKALVIEGLTMGAAEEGGLRFRPVNCWSECIKGIKLLHTMESLEFKRCRGLTADGFLAISAATGIPNLKEYKITGGDGEDLDADPLRVEKFVVSPIAATLKELSFGRIVFCDDGLRQLVQYAPTMKCLKSLTICLKKRRQLEIFATLLSHDAWPKLEELNLPITYRYRSAAALAEEESWFEALCKDYFFPIWPNLKLSITSIR